ncbi:hypothetical protein AB0903_21695 [Streptomyces sp. NPDC048389]|uniref:hypothetical protein n=1 Tax=Streptomyces sp. NPDC048389 TaxID=3154622 RepID=UPI0034526FFC
MTTQGWTGARTRTAGTAALVAAALLTGGCGPKSDDGKDGAGDATVATASAASVSPSPSVTTASKSPSSSPSSTPPASASPSASKPAPLRTPAAPPTTTRPPKPTVLSMHASAGGGPLNLSRGGAAREFTVSVGNGSTRAYGALRVVFQMEMMFGADGGTAPPQNGFSLERRDPATGAWKTVELRVANDVQPHYLFSGGAPLGKDATRTERYRIRAERSGPTGSTALMIRLIDTTAPESAAYERGVPAATSLMVTARRG